MPLRTLPIIGWLSKYLTLFVTFIIAYFAPLGADLAAMGALITIDFLLGLMAAHKTKVKITSNKMSQTVVKALVYMMLLIAGFVIQTTLVTYLPLVHICLAFLSVVEFTSIGENFSKITGLPFAKFIKEKLMEYTKKHSDE